MRLRDRKTLKSRIAAQRAAIGLFQLRGFENVSVVEIAEACDASPASIYRWFGNKERLVLWSERGDEILQVVSSRIAECPTLDTIICALSEALGSASEEDLPLRLARARLMNREPALQAAVAIDWAHARDHVAKVLAIAKGRAHPGLEEETLAATGAMIFQIAMREWERLDAARPIAELVTETYEALVDGIRLGGRRRSSGRQ